MTRDHSLSIGPPADDAEVQAFTSIVSQALFYPGADLEGWAEREGLENIRVARRDGKVAGGLSCQPMGQWFGGRSVGMGGVRAVAVAPEHRAGGVGGELVRVVLEEMHREGVPLSALYPATQPVYRRAGFEQAGVRLGYRLSARALELRDHTLDIHRIEESDWPVVHDLYQERAQRTSGNLDRNAWAWQRVLDAPPWVKPTYGYLAMGDGEPEGYVVVSQNVDPEFEHDNQLNVVDFVIRTPEAGRRLWTLLADHRSVAEHILCYGAPADPLVLLLTEQNFKIADRMDWMLRLVDVRAALEARGYPAGVAAELHLEVADDVLAHNNRRFVLQVADRRAQGKEGGRGELRVDVRGLAAMYTGHHAPTDLKAAGYLDGSDATLADAGAVFSGPAPWMPDVF